MKIKKTKRKSGKCTWNEQISYYGSLQCNFCLTPSLHFTVNLRFSPTLILPLVGISVLLAESSGIHPLSQIHSDVINANVSILRLTARCTTGCASMLYEGVYENVRQRRRERKGRSEDPEGCSHVFVSYPRCTGDVPSGTCVHMCACVECVCLHRHQILPHNFGIFHWHTQSKPRTCANSFTDDRYSLARENKRKRTGGRVLGGFLLCMVRRYNACEGYTRELRARGSSWIIEILVQGVVSCQVSDSLLDEIYLLIISIF